MTMSMTVAELDAQIAARRGRLAAIVGEMREVLRADIPAWMTRRARAAFLGQPALARALDGAQVTALKRGAEREGARVAAEVDAALADPAVWVTGGAGPSDTKALHGVPAWGELARVGAALTALLADAGLTSDAEGSAYHAPVTFVAGHFFPSLAEHFWALTAELADLEQRRGELADSALREALAQRWNDA
jgi:hypothetical protein